MKEKRRSRITKMHRFAAACFLFLILFFIGQGFVMAKEGTQEPVTIKVQIGYEGYGKFGRYIPVRVELTSQIHIKGIWQIIVPAKDGEENYAYEYPVTLEAGKTVSMRTDIPLLSGYTQLYMEFIGEDGRSYGSCESRVSTPASQLTELFVGVLAKDDEVYRVFDGINVGEFTDSGFPYVVTRAFSLKIEDIQNTVYSMESMDILVFDRDSYQRLSDIQRQTLINWVKSGGILLREIGDEEEWFIEDGKTITEPREVRPVCWMQSKGMDAGHISTIWIESDETDLVRYLLENRELAGAIIGNACSSEKISEIEKRDHTYGNTEIYSSIASMLAGNVLKKLPNVSVYIVVIALYLILAGPVLYLVLRRMDKIKWLKWMVALLAILFSIFIYGLSGETRVNSPFIQYASIIELEEKQKKESTYFSIQSPSHKLYTIKIDASYFLKPISKQEQYYYSNVVNDRVLTQYTSALFDGPEETSIVRKDTAAFRSQYYLAEKYSDNVKYEMQIDADIVWYCEKLTGTVTNHTGKKLFNPMVLVDNFVLLLPDLENGQSVSLQDGERIYYSPSGYEKQAEIITGLSDRKNQMLGTKENQKLLRRTKLLSYYLMQELSAEKTDIEILAFIEEDGPFSEAANVDNYGVTMLKKQCDFQTERSGYIEERLADSKITVLDGEYDPIHGIGSSGNVSLEYEIGSVSGMLGLHFADYIVEEDNPQYKTFDGRVFAYNSSTSKYDGLDLLKGDVSIQDLMDYLIVDRNGTYTLVLLYVSDPMASEMGQKICLPRVSVIRKTGH